MYDTLLVVFSQHPTALNMALPAAILSGLSLLFLTKRLIPTKKENKLLTTFLILTSLIGSTLLVLGTIWTIKWLSTISVAAAIGGGIFAGVFALSAIILLFLSTTLLVFLGKIGIKDAMKSPKEKKKGTEL